MLFASLVQFGNEVSAKGEPETPDSTTTGRALLKPNGPLALAPGAMHQRSVALLPLLLIGVEPGRAKPSQELPMLVNDAICNNNPKLRP